MASSASQAGAEDTTTPSTDEKAIRDLVEAWAQAVRDGDMDGVLAHHTMDVVMFDVPLPLQRTGLAAYRAAWEPFLSGGPHRGFTLGELSITAGGAAAFCHALVRVGDENDFAVRLTLGLVKARGRWLIAHEHHSAPLAEG
ncbi:SgcJ/EcaC family oxidoreductase [Chondromyces crocatus]|uniref:YybH family protein n=1 Tax=Chondromyces crocatus TaxID=52 RepID=UPI00316AC26E